MTAIDFTARGMVRKLDADLFSAGTNGSAWRIGARGGGSVQDRLDGYATRTALKALTPLAGDRLFLKEAGRSGEFVFDASNLSAAVTTDTEEGIHIAPASDPSGASGTWVRQFEGKIYATWFGIDPSDGTDATDHAAALQCAHYTAALFISGDTAAPTIVLPQGRYNVGSTVEMAVPMGGGSALNAGVRIFWIGAADGVMFTKDNTYVGGCSYGLIENISFRAGANKPATYLQFDGLIDVGFRLRELHFYQCSGNPIECNAGWVNCHWGHLRFDGIDGYCIYLKPYASQSLSSFVLQGFTWDSNGASGDTKGVIGVDVSLNNTNVGVVALIDGRMETNTYKLAQGFVNWFTTDAAKVGTVEFVLERIAYNDAASSTTDCLLWQSRAGGSNGGGYLHVRDVWHNLSAIMTFDGSTKWWGSNTILPTTANGKIAEMVLKTSGAQPIHFFGANGVEIVTNTNTDDGLQIRIRTDANPRTHLTPNGSLLLGPGGGTAPDVEIKRVSGRANQLVLATGDSLVPETTGGLLGNSTYQWQVYTKVVATASLPTAASSMDGTLIIEDGGPGDRNLVIYAGGQRFRIDGGSSF